MDKRNLPFCGKVFMFWEIFVDAYCPETLLSVRLRKSSWGYFKIVILQHCNCKIILHQASATMDKATNEELISLLGACQT
jgi:hypothetical protein